MVSNSHCIRLIERKTGDSLAYDLCDDLYHKLSISIDFFVFTVGVPRRVSWKAAFP